MPGPDLSPDAFMDEVKKFLQAVDANEKRIRKTSVVGKLPKEENEAIAKGR